MPARQTSAQPAKIPAGSLPADLTECVYKSLSRQAVIDAAQRERRHEGADTRLFCFDEFVDTVRNSNDLAYMRSNESSRLLVTPLAKHFANVMVSRHAERSIAAELKTGKELLQEVQPRRRRLSSDAEMVFSGSEVVTVAQQQDLSAVPPVAHRWIHTANQFIGPYFIFDRDIELSVETELVLGCKLALGLQDKVFTTPDQRDPDTKLEAHELFNRIIAFVREGANTQRFAEARRQRREHAKRQYATCVAYAKGLFEHFPSLVFAQVDLNYTGLPSHRSRQQYKNDIEHFLNNRRSNGIFKHLVGYIATPSHWQKTGYHWEVTLIFDGSTIEEKALPLVQIGEFWKGILGDGSGGYRIIDQQADGFRPIAIGYIERHDSTRRRGLLLAFAYRAKVEQYFRLKEGRSLLKGGLPAPIVQK